MNFEKLIWKQADPELQAPSFRREFTVTDPEKAVIDICGLGFFELYINGKKVSDDLFVPAWSNYEPRLNRRIIYPINDEMCYRTYYLEYDVTSYLNTGKNCIYVILGNGWYNQHERNCEGDFWYGTPKLAFTMDITEKDGNIITLHSGESLKWADSDITRTNIYFGEDRDLRVNAESPKYAGFDDSGWNEAEIAKTPETVFYKQNFPADKVIRTITPKLIADCDGRKVYDLGENITGYAYVTCTGASGEKVTVTHSEEINEDGTLNYDSAGGNGQIQTDTFICSGTERTVNAKFTWHAFRYAEVTGPAHIDTVAVVHTDIPVTATFESSSEELNWLFDAYVRTQLDNYHCCIPSDCPHRERLGYTGDGQLTCDTAMYVFDCRALYEKWMRDIADCQDVNNGHVQHTAPFYGGGGGPGGWGGAIYVVPMTMYRHFGDKGILEKYLPNIRKWIDYMWSRSENGIVMREEEGGWCLGDWCTPEFPPSVPNEFINTYYYIKGMRACVEAFRILEKEPDEELLSRLEITEKTFVERFLDKKTGSFCNGHNAADAFAIDLGLHTEQTVKNLIAKYEELGTFDTGIFGTDVLIDVLFKLNRGDIALKLFTNLTETSFEFMRKAGATTIWEDWDGRGSHNHPMFGAVIRSFFTHILGIRQKEGSAGFKEYEVKPVKIPGLSAKGSITTVNGVITSTVEN